MSVKAKANKKANILYSGSFKVSVAKIDNILDL